MLVGCFQLFVGRKCTGHTKLWGGLRSKLVLEVTATTSSALLTATAAISCAQTSWKSASASYRPNAAAWASPAALIPQCKVHMAAERAASPSTTHVRQQCRPRRRTSRNFLRPPFAARPPSRAALAAAAAAAAAWCCRCRCSQAVWREFRGFWVGSGPGLGPWPGPVLRRCCSTAAAAAALAASPCRCRCSQAARLRSCACGKMQQ